MAEDERGSASRTEVIPGAPSSRRDEEVDPEADGLDPTATRPAGGQGAGTVEAPESTSTPGAPAGAFPERASDTSSPPTKTEEPKRQPHKKKRSFLTKATELPILLILAFAIAILIKTFLVQAFFIPSGSMIPTLQVGDRVLVEKLGYRWGSPSQGDIVVFAKEVFNGDQPDYPWYDRGRIMLRELLGLPTGAEEDYIKRIVAVGGDSVRYAGSPRRLIVNGDEVDQPYIKGGRDNGSPSLTASDCKRLDMDKAGKGCRVPAGHVFVMGDNRGNSEDSRILGPVAEDKIVGRAFLILWPVRDFGTL